MHFRISPRFFCLLLTLVATGAAGWAQTDVVSVTSPSGAIEFRVMVSAIPGPEVHQPQLAYQVDYKGRPLLETSFMGFEIFSQNPLGEKPGLTDTHRTTVDETYTLPAGKTREVRNHYNSLIADYLQNGSLGRRVNVEVRAFDDGVAFRYLIPRTSPLEDMRIEAELTQFHFAADGEAFPLILDGYESSYEGDYQRTTVEAIDPEALVALPFLAQVPGTGWVAITEAHLENYAGMYLWHQAENTMAAALSPRQDTSGLVVRRDTPLATPWRVLLIGDTPTELIESNLVTSLNPPSAISDTSWIQPGKTAWNWWSGTQADGVGFKPGMNTATMKHYVDFASEAGLEYMLIDAGWSAPGEDNRQDLLKTVPEINLPEIIEYAKSKNVGIWLWAHWTSVEAQMEEAFARFEQLGVRGVKIDFMNRDDQWMVDFYHRAARSAAAHHLMVNFHGAYKPDGMRRTWPNVITREAVLGLEYSKWSDRVTPQHDVTLAFTRMLAGPMDYTPGGFNNVTRDQFEPRNLRPMVLGTRAHQLALYVVFESPTMMVSDYPEAYAGQRDFDFIKAVPASWDETRATSGEVGEFVTIARRRGEEWYLGSITNWSSREVEVPLGFLGGGAWIAEIYADADDAGTNPKHTRIEERRVSASDTLALQLASGGGAAVRFRRAE